MHISTMLDIKRTCSIGFFLLNSKIHCLRSVGYEPLIIFRAVVQMPLCSVPPSSELFPKIFVGDSHVDSSEYFKPALLDPNDGG